ncbi:MAG: hypothetical protein KAR12_10615 [Methylococcales bacterium]|nr:hypothetical protein [Methylococcales bacterium]
MRRQQSSNNTLGWLWVILMLTNSVPSIVFAEGNKEITPKNTHPKTYESGWESVTPDIIKMARFAMLLKYLKMHT